MPWPTIPTRQRRIISTAVLAGVLLFLVLLVPILAAAAAVLGIVYGVYRLVRWGLNTDHQEHLTRDLDALWAEAKQ